MFILVFRINYSIFFRNNLKKYKIIYNHFDILFIQQLSPQGLSASEKINKIKNSFFCGFFSDAPSPCGYPYISNWLTLTSFNQVRPVAIWHNFRDLTFLFLYKISCFRILEWKYDLSSTLFKFKHWHCDHFYPRFKQITFLSNIVAGPGWLNELGSWIT